MSGLNCETHIHISVVIPMCRSGRTLTLISSMALWRPACKTTAGLDLQSLIPTTNQHLIVGLIYLGPAKSRGVLLAPTRCSHCCVNMSSNERLDLRSGSLLPSLFNTSYERRLTWPRETRRCQLQLQCSTVARRRHESAMLCSSSRWSGATAHSMDKELQPHGYWRFCPCSSIDDDSDMIWNRLQRLLEVL